MKRGSSFFVLLFLIISLSFASAAFSITITGKVIENTTNCSIKLTINEGQLQEIDGKAISIEYMDTEKVKMNVQGEITNSLHVGDSEELYDGKIITINDFYFPEKTNETGNVTFTFPLNSCYQEPTCTDSDGGFNYGVKGSVVWTSNLGSTNTTDYCQGNVLYEFFCQYSTTQAISHDCSKENKICSNGACISDPSTQACAETDNGVNYYLKGNVLDIAHGNANYWDSCILPNNPDNALEGGWTPVSQGDYIIEYYCGPNNYQYTLYQCPNGCKDGACVLLDSTTSCKDTDGGKNYYVRGNSTSDNRTLIEGCVAGTNNVREFYCGEDGRIYDEDYPCPNGCKDGACVQENLCSSQISMNITGSGNYLVKKDTLINANYISAYVREISWALQGDTEPRIDINGETAQYCYIHAGEECFFYYGSTTHPTSKNLMIRANSINTNEDSPDDSTACITVSEINETISYPAYNCTDTDGGANYYVRGHLIDALHHADYWDTCLDAMTLREHYCGENNYQYVYYNCTKGCLDGACLVECKVNADCYSGYICENGEGVGDAQGGPSADQLKCMNAGGTWKTFSNGCADSCDYARNRRRVACTQAITEGCDCGTDKCWTGTACELNNIPSPQLTCNSGCLLNDKCYTFGYRKSGRYCSDNSEFVEELGDEEVCENNFECRSNLCIDGQCINQGMFKKFMSWFRNSFGRRHR